MLTIRPIRRKVGKYHPIHYDAIFLHYAIFFFCLHLAYIHYGKWGVLGGIVVFLIACFLGTIKSDDGIAPTSTDEKTSSEAKIASFAQ